MFLIHIDKNSLLGRYHLSQIYAGLYDLAAENRIKLRFSSELSSEPLFEHGNLLWLKVEDSSCGEVRVIGFDMEDSGRPIAKQAIEQADIYFKRSYDNSFLVDIEESLRQKVLPYGLNYGCNSRNEDKSKKLVYLLFSAVCQLPRNPSPLLRRVLSGMVLPQSDRFVIKANEPTEKKVLFLTRAWVDGTASGTNKNIRWKTLNDTRAETIRVLRNEFGEDFIGGMQPTPFAKKHYPDCISPYNTDKKNYLKLVRKCLVTVTTNGLWDSIGWKFSEYLAASRCIVTEPLKYDLPVPIIEGENILTFNTPNECVLACKKILNNSDFSRNMRQNNEIYYQNEIKPSTLIMNRLENAFST